MKDVAFMGPSSTKGATIARRRRPAMKVIVFQCPVRYMVAQPNATPAAAAKPHHGGVG